MMMEQTTERTDRAPENHTGSLFMGMVLGTLVGGTIALLSAPQSGEKTLAKLTGRSRGLKRRRKNATKRLMTQVSDVTGEVRKRAKNVVSATRGECICR